MAEAHKPRSRPTSLTSRPCRALNQMRSWSTMLMMAMGTSKKTAAMATILSKAPSGGVSRMSYRRTAAIRRDSSSSSFVTMDVALASFRRRSRQVRERCSRV